MICCRIRGSYSHVHTLYYFHVNLDFFAELQKLAKFMFDFVSLVVICREHLYYHRVILVLALHNPADLRQLQSHLKIFMMI